MNEPIKRVVVFTKTNARILINNTMPLKKGLPFLVNPRFDTGNMWPQYWKPGENGNVVVMDPAERAQRDKDILIHGIDNEIFEPQPIEPEVVAPAVIVPFWMKFQPKKAFLSMSDEQRHLYFLTILMLAILIVMILTVHK